MAGRVCVTGGSGFVGTAVIEELVRRGYAINALVGRKPIAIGGDQVTSIPGGLFNAKALDAATRGCDAVIHLVGIIMERPSAGVTFDRIHVQGTKAIVDAAKRNDVGRYLQMSALGARPDAVSNYHKTKFLAEEYVRASGLDWTIFRPSLIHGPRGEFMKMEAKWARGKAPPFLFMPYFGAGLLGRGGAGTLQPVAVADVARAFVDSLENAETVGEVFPIAGTEQLTWPQMHRASAEAIVGRRRAVMAVPAWYAKLLAGTAAFFGLGSLLPFNRDQVIMSQEDNITDLTKFKDLFGWEPQGFAPALASYAERL